MTIDEENTVGKFTNVDNSNVKISNEENNLLGNHENSNNHDNNAKYCHDYCIVCGSNNHRSMGLKFVTDANGITTTIFHGNPSFQGYNGILHGGIITTLLDATMTHCLFNQNVMALTGDLQVRFLHPIPHDAILTIQAEIVNIKKSIYFVQSKIILHDKVMAYAKAKFKQVDFLNKAKTC